MYNNFDKTNNLYYIFIVLNFKITLEINLVQYKVQKESIANQPMNQNSEYIQSIAIQ